MTNPIYGIKVAKPGFDVKTATDQQLAFSSEFDTLKIKQQGTGQLTDTSRTVTIAHNLGYVPTFMVHTQFSSDGAYFISPLINTQPFFFPANNGEILTWADSTNLYVKAQSGVGKTLQYMGNKDDIYSNFLGTTDSFLVGNSATYGSLKGAIRFPNVQVNQGATLYQAILHLYYWEKGSGSGNLQYICKGFDEDNTANFSGGDPWGRSTTSASVSSSASLGSAPTEFTINVKGIVEEIIGRSGWSKGNAVGLQVDNNSSPSDVWMHGLYSGYESSSYLELMTTSVLANFKYTIFYNKIV